MSRNRGDMKTARFLKSIYSYFIAKLFPFPLNSILTRGFTCPEEPMLSQPAISILKELATSSKSSLEFGSGGSTVFIARHALKVITVESDYIFSGSVKRTLKQNNLGNVEVLDVNIGPVTSGGQPLKQLKWIYRKKWENYATSPWKQLGSDYVADIIFIDGRFRVSCFIQTLLRNGSNPYYILFDDYRLRTQYHVIESAVTPISYHGDAALFRISGDNLSIASKLLGINFEDFS